VDSSSNIGWNPSISPLRGSELKKPTFTPGETAEAAPASVGDGVTLSGGPVLHEKMMIVDGSVAEAAPKPHAPAATPRESVPVNLLAEDFSTTMLGGISSNSNPLAGLGVLAQLDEAGPVHATRAIDGASQPSAFADLHLVGPQNAGKYLGNPDGLYLGM